MDGKNNLNNQQEKFKRFGWNNVKHEERLHQNHSYSSVCSQTPRSVSEHLVRGLPMMLSVYKPLLQIITKSPPGRLLATTWTITTLSYVVNTHITRYCHTQLVVSWPLTSRKSGSVECSGSIGSLYLSMAMTLTLHIELESVGKRVHCDWLRGSNKSENEKGNGRKRLYAASQNWLWWSATCHRSKERAARTSLAGLPVSLYACPIQITAPCWYGDLFPASVLNSGESENCGTSDTYMPLNVHLTQSQSSWNSD